VLIQYKKLFSVVILLLLAACGGGGGGSSAVTSITFTAWNQVGSSGYPVQVKNFDIVANQGAWATTSNTITSVTTASSVAGSALTINYSAANTPTSATYTNSSLGETNTYDTVGAVRDGYWSTYMNDIFYLAYDSAEDAANITGPNGGMFYIEPAITQASSGCSLYKCDVWLYQTFGFWYDDDSCTISSCPTNNNGNFGSFSVGSATPGSSVPTTGTGTFYGRAGGWFFDIPNGRVFAVAQLFDASVNFATRSIAVSTGGITNYKTNFVTGVAGGYDTGLQWTGTLTYAANSANFSGSISTDSTYNMSGTASGTFYGPLATELGGQFVLDSTNYKYSGAFGAYKQ